MPTCRDFVATTALLTAAPWIAPSIAKARTASDRITLGFIGVGKQSLGHLNKFLGNKEVEVVAVCEVVKARLDKAIETVNTKYAERTKSGEYKGLNSFGDFRELLGLDGLDAVVIGTPDHWHAIPCILAAQAGKHIYCEKPLTHNTHLGSSRREVYRGR